jgi:hypothetical protein
MLSERVGLELLLGEKHHKTGLYTGWVFAGVVFPLKMVVQISIVPIVHMRPRINPPAQETLLVGRVHVLIQLRVAIVAPPAKSALRVPFESRFCHRAFLIALPLVALQGRLGVQLLLGDENLAALQAYVAEVQATGLGQMGLECLDG